MGIHRLLLRRSLPIVLCFHRVSYEHSPAYPPLSPDIFKKVLNYCSQRFNIVDLGELNGESHRPKMAITFDDGFYDFITVALPIIEDLKVPVSLNIIVSCANDGQPHWTQKMSCLVERFAELGLQPHMEHQPIGVRLIRGKNEEKVALKLYELLRNKGLVSILHIIEKWEKELNFYDYTKMISWDDLKIMLKKYPFIKIGSHTINHISLIGDESKEVLAHEIIDSAVIIQNQLNVKIDRFASPNGAYSNQSLEVIEQSMYKFIQFTDIKPSNVSRTGKEYFSRCYPRFSSLSENIFYIYGFHNFVNRSIFKFRKP